jgi:hypothetical protein
MGKGFKHGASGAKKKEENPLNFELVAYPSEVELNVATPAENTIGVITQNPITGWYFSATQPENMKEGEVWISVGASSGVEFNALKEKMIMVYPASVKQWVNSKLNDVTAKSYKNGAWVEWRSGGYIFSSNSGLTSGYTLILSKASTSSEVVVNEKSITFKACAVETHGEVGIGIAEEVDMSNYKTLNCKFTLDSSGSNNDGEPYGAVLGVRNSAMIDNKPGNGTWLAKKYDTKGLGEKTISVDISAVSAGYVAFSGIMSGTLHDLWME